MQVQVKRVYDPPEAADGRRVLVDRLWPRGVTKDQAQLTGWLRGVAPTAALRKWFGHDPARFAEFSQLYVVELATREEARAGVAQLLDWASQGTLTLVYGARDPIHNQAMVLLHYLQKMD
ncbi:DUF488 family protein [Alicyclobacillaceae bacterium I2511]|nr:DUF488 family protein [Alicyclobacillaceae bacterium I2511]